MTSNKIQEFERRRQEAFAEKQKLAKELFSDYDVAEHPKAQRIFNLAWEYGHGCGELEIRGYFAQLVELIQN